jgi:hypothetical protein
MRIKMNRNARSKPATLTTPKQLKRQQIMRWLLASTLIIFSGAGLSLAGWLFSNGVPVASATAQNDGISPQALAQIEALIRDKESRTGVQQKMDSQLIYELKMRRGDMVAEGVRTIETDLPYTDQGKVILDLKAKASNALLNQLKTYGADILTVPEHDSMRIQVDMNQIEAIAALPDVIFIQPKQAAMTSRVVKAAQDGPKPAVIDDRGTEFDGRAAKVRSLVATALLNEAVTNAGTGVGSRSSEGDVTHRASTARGAFNIDGTGIKIGVLSDGVTNLAASQASGDLGPVTVLPGQAGSGDEGTAMLEIIHDVAPGAQLFFATAFSGITSFAQNIRDLRAAGCDIIVDDVFYFVETPFQDGQAPGVVSNTNGGVVIQAVNDVTASGALYFSSAGNSGNLNDGTAGVWEGNFVDGGPTGAPLPVGSLHNFGGQNFNLLTVAGSGPINLYWSDPLGGSSNDYDLFRLNAAGTAVIGGSTNIQNGTQDPYEQMSQSTASPRIVIVKKTGAADRFLHLNANRGRFSIATAGQTHGHAAAANAYGCAATPAGAAFPNPFSSLNVVETFSSDGPRRIFFQPDGTPITPGDFSATGGLLRQKPDITAADGVSVTGVGGFPSPFFGTSAAAPHAAAIAGLLKSANPSFTPAQIRQALTGSAIDIEASGVDRDSGAGIIDAFAALQALGVPGFANLELGAVTASENPGDGNGQIDAGEGARLAIQLKNTGVINATGITAALTTSTPGVTITQPATFGYPDLPGLGGSGVGAAPFLFTVAGDALCPLTINFTLTVSYAGGASAGPKVFNFTVQTGPPAISISSTLDTVAPTAGPGFTTATGTIGVRHFRDGVASSCGSAKAFPGTTQPGARQFDAYTFETCPTSAGGCVTVTLSGANGLNLFSAAYSGNFNPADLSQNYLADAGASAATRTYSFDVPPGRQTFTVVVTDVPPGPPSGSGYTLSVSGACIGSCPTVNHPPVAMCQNVTVEAGAGCLADASINNGSFDPDGDPLTITQTPAGPYPVGTTNVLLTVTDSKGATSQCSSTVTVLSPTTTTVSTPAPIQYSDVVTLSSATFAQFCPSPTPTGSVEFFVNDVSVGAAPVDGSGVATKNAQILLAAGSYPVKAVFTSSNPITRGSLGTSTLTVTKESAVVTPSASNPTVVKVNHPGGTAGPITLCATVKEASDGSPGDISLATPVTFTLTPFVPGAPPITRTATTSGGGVGGTLNACVTLTNVPANVYDVAVNVGGNHYSGSGSAVLVVFDPSPGFVTGAGTITRNGAPAVFAFSARFQRNDKVEGSLIYVERRQSGEVKLEIVSIDSLAIVGNTGVLIGKAIFNGGGCTFRATAIDNDLLGRHDKFGLQVTTPGGAVIPDLTFDPITLTSGNILVPHQSGNNTALK